MIDLRHKMFAPKGKEPGRKICPIIPPIIHTKVVEGCGKTATTTDVIPVICYGEGCEFFCEIHEMCMHKCDHIEMVHGLGFIDEEDDCVG